MRTAPTGDHGLRVATRASPLARRQTAQICAALHAMAPAAPEPEIVIIRTTGDRVQDRPLREIGGKGLFTREIDRAVQAAEVDCAVHSLKDVETILAPGLVIAAVPRRLDPRDTLFAKTARTIPALPRGARLGTSSLRRAAQVRHLRPDIAIVPLRGNVDTRLAKLASGDIDATLLAMAGLLRLGRAGASGAAGATGATGATGELGAPLEPEVILPAVGQGALAIICRADDAATRTRLAALDDARSRSAVTAERAMLAALDGSCNTPIGGLAEVEGDVVRLRGLVAAPDGSVLYRGERRGAATDAAALGQDLGAELRARAGDAFFAALGYA